jgi:hypothetical protein
MGKELANWRQVQPDNLPSFRITFERPRDSPALFPKTWVGLLLFCCRYFIFWQPSPLWVASISMVICCHLQTHEELSKDFKKQVLQYFWNVISFSRQHDQLFNKQSLSAKNSPRTSSWCHHGGIIEQEEARTPLQRYNHRFRCLHNNPENEPNTLIQCTSMMSRCQGLSPPQKRWERVKQCVAIGGGGECPPDVGRWKKCFSIHILT